MTDTTPAGVDTIDDSPFDSPAPGGKFPTLAQLEGRLCIFEPKGTPSEVPDTFNPGKMKLRASVDITILDGPPITHHIDKDGDATELPEPIVPGTDTSLLRGMYVSQTKVVSQLSGRSMVLGRVVKLPKIAGSTNNRAWGITDIPALAKAGDGQAQKDLKVGIEYINKRSPFGG